jgi:hypothetical protein
MLFRRAWTTSEVWRSSGAGTLFRPQPRARSSFASSVSGSCGPPGRLRPSPSRSRRGGSRAGRCGSCPLARSCLVARRAAVPRRSLSGGPRQRSTGLTSTAVSNGAPSAPRASTSNSSGPPTRSERLQSWDRGHRGRLPDVLHHGLGSGGLMQASTWCSLGRPRRPENSSGGRSRPASFRDGPAAS